MTNIQQIAIPVDFHQHTDELAAFATSIAGKLGARPTFIHVVEQIATVASYSEFYPATYLEIDEEIHGYAKKMMAALLEKNKSVCPDCQGLVLRGDVADGIVEYAGKQAADLIIMGTHGAKGIEKILLGSVAERVLKRASCPILLFNPYKGERGYKISSPISASVQPV